MPDRPVAMPQPRRAIDQSFAAAQAGENVVNYRLICVKLDNVPANVFVARISEKIKLA